MTAHQRHKFKSTIAATSSHGPACIGSTVRGQAGLAVYDTEQPSL